MKVNELGEFGLIDLLAGIISERQTQQTPNPRLLIGIGDDAAAWRVPDEIQLATVDTMVEGTHFTLDTITWRQLGWKALAMNISDIVAMAGVPDYALAALTLPEDIEVEDLTELYHGMLDIAGVYGTTITGGNISRGPVFVISITVLGSGREDILLRRSNAKPGDLVAVTGYPGSAAAGLKMISEKPDLPEKTRDYLSQAFLKPLPRMVEAQSLVRNGIRAAIDISDGLVSDLEHVCRASRVGARINADALPVHPLVQEAFGDSARELTLSGGEAYELLFTGPRDKVECTVSDLNMQAAVIGEITEADPGAVEIVDGAGNPIELKKPGWRHF